MEKPANNPRAVIGGNNPPDAMDEALAPFGDVIAEAEQWLDGTKVTNEGQMKAVDVLTKGMKAARKAIDDARDTATKPLHTAWQDEIARWRPAQVDLDAMVKGLVALTDDFKRALAAEKAAEAARQWEAADIARKAAEALARAADAGNIEAQRDARAAMEAADLARAQASVASKDTVKGLRKVTHHEVTDHKALLHWIARNDRDIVTAFIDEWAQKNHKTHPAADGLRVWETKEGF